MIRARRRCALLLLLLIGNFTGCCSARYVAESRDRAIVAISSNTNEWPSYNRKHAEELMARKFPNGYVIDQEGEAVVGQTVAVNTERNTVLGFGEVRQTTRTTDQKEWQIAFRSKDAPPPPLVTGMPLAPAVVPIQRVSMPPQGMPPLAPPPGGLPLQPVPVMPPL